MRCRDVAVCTCADYGSLDSIPAMAEAVLRTAPERFSIAGHSMGGRVALEIYRLAPESRGAHRAAQYRILAAGRGRGGRRRNPQTRGTGRAGAIARHARDARAMAAADDRFAPHQRHRASERDHRNDVAQNSRDFRRAGAGAAGPAGRERGPGTNPCPALLLTGREDGWSSPAQHAAMAAKIRRQPAGDRARLRPHVDDGTARRSQRRAAGVALYLFDM